MATICLNMIVKDEAHVIRRCLDSVRPLIDTWCILDTGSSDGSQELIRQHLRDLPGQLRQSAWKPGDLLFVEPSLHRWRCLDEFAVAAYWAGRPGESLAACERLLSQGHLPEPEVARVQANREFARTALGAAN